MYVESFVVCIVCKLALDVGMVWKYCGIIPTLFGWFLRVPSLHALFSFGKLFYDLYLICVCVCVCLCVLEMVREKRGRRGGQGEDAWSVKYEKYGTCMLFTEKQSLQIRTPSSEIVKTIAIKLLYKSRNCYPCKLHVLSCVESLHTCTYLFMYNSPSNTYLVILLLEGYTHPLCTFCSIPPDLAVIMYFVSATTSLL